MTNPPGAGQDPAPIQSGDRAAGTVMRNSAWLIGQPLALNVISIASTGYIARQLGAEGFATFNIGMAFATMFSPLTNMGLRALTVRHVAQNRDDADGYLGRVMTLRLALGIGTLLIVLMVIPLTSDAELTRQVTLISSPVLVINTVVGVYTDALHAFERMGHAARAMMWGGIVLTVSSVVVVAMGGGPVALAGSYLLGPIVTAILLTYATRHIGVRPRLIWDYRAFRALLREATPFFGQGVFESIGGRLDLFVLTRTIGEAGLGGYTAAGQLISRASVVVEGASSALLPSLARTRVTEPEAAVALLRHSLRALLAFTVPMAVCVALASPELLLAIFGDGYRDGAGVLALSIMVLPLTAAAMAIGHGLFVAHKNALVVRSSMVSTGLSSALIVPAAISLGVLGAPIARLFGRAVLLAQRLPEAVRLYHSMWSWADSGRVLGVTVASALPFAMLRIADGGQRGLVFAVLAATPIYVVSVLVSGLLPSEVVDRVRRMVGMK